MNRLKFPRHWRSPDMIASLVSAWHDVSLEEIASRDQSARPSAARQDLALLLERHTGLTLAQIGLALGDRHESTVAGLLRSAARQCGSDPEQAAHQENLRAAVLALPDGASLMPMPGATPADVARSAIAGAREPSAFERLAIGVVSAVEVLRSPDLTADEARRTALSLLCRPGQSTGATIIPLPQKGKAQ